MRSAHRVDWSNPEDPIVAACLSVRCGTCKAPAGEPCRSTVPGHKLLRTVHHFRHDKVIGKENK